MHNILKLYKVVFILQCLVSARSSVSKNNKADKTKDLKYILLWEAKGTFKNIFGKGQQAFLQNNCPVDNCYVSTESNQFSLKKYDAILFNGWDQTWLKKMKFPIKRYHHQKYAFVQRESAANSYVCHKKFDEFFNWTITYKLNSDIVFPYIHIRDMNMNVIGPKKDMHWINNMLEIDKTFAKDLKTKTQAVVRFDLKCTPSYNKYIDELQRALVNKYGLRVHVYGKCGSLQCPRHDCDQMLDDQYHFYLAAEDSVAEDFVTDDVLRALRNNVVPVVYGGADYNRFLPPGSYLDGTKKSVEAIAADINMLIKNHTQYRQYFRWKYHYNFCSGLASSALPSAPGRSFCGQTLCDLCKALNDPRHFKVHSVYGDFRKWWYPDYAEKCPKQSTSTSESLSTPLPMLEDKQKRLKIESKQLQDITNWLKLKAHAGNVIKEGKKAKVTKKKISNRFPNIFKDQKEKIMSKVQNNGKKKNNGVKKSKGINEETEDIFVYTDKQNTDNVSFKSQINRKNGRNKIKKKGNKAKGISDTILLRSISAISTNTLNNAKNYKINIKQNEKYKEEKYKKKKTDKKPVIHSSLWSPVHTQKSIMQNIHDILDKALSNVDENFNSSPEITLRNDEYLENKNLNEEYKESEELDKNTEHDELTDKIEQTTAQEPEQLTEEKKPAQNRKAKQYGATIEQIHSINPVEDEESPILKKPMKAVKVAKPTEHKWLIKEIQDMKPMEENTRIKIGAEIIPIEHKREKRDINPITTKIMVKNIKLSTQKMPTKSIERPESITQTLLKQIKSIKNKEHNEPTKTNGIDMNKENEPNKIVEYKERDPDKKMEDNKPQIKQHGQNEDKRYYQYREQQKIRIVKNREITLRENKKERKRKSIPVDWGMLLQLAGSLKQMQNKLRIQEIWKEINKQKEQHRYRELGKPEETQYQEITFKEKERKKTEAAWQEMIPLLKFLNQLTYRELKTSERNKTNNVRKNMDKWLAALEQIRNEKLDDNEDKELNEEREQKETQNALKKMEQWLALTEQEEEECKEDQHKQHSYKEQEKNENTWKEQNVTEDVRLNMDKLLHDLENIKKKDSENDDEMELVEEERQKETQNALKKIEQYLALIQQEKQEDEEEKHLYKEQRKRENKWKEQNETLDIRQNMDKLLHDLESIKKKKSENNDNKLKVGRKREQNKTKNALEKMQQWLAVIQQEEEQYKKDQESHHLYKEQEKEENRSIIQNEARDIRQNINKLLLDLKNIKKEKSVNSDEKKLTEERKKTETKIPLQKMELLLAKNNDKKNLGQERAQTETENALQKMEQLLAVIEKKVEEKVKDKSKHHLHQKQEKGKNTRKEQNKTQNTRQNSDKWIATLEGFKKEVLQNSDKKELGQEREQTETEDALQKMEQLLAVIEKKVEDNVKDKKKQQLHKKQEKEKTRKEQNKTQNIPQNTNKWLAALEEFKKGLLKNNDNKELREGNEQKVTENALPKMEQLLAFIEQPLEDNVKYQKKQHVHKEQQKGEYTRKEKEKEQIKRNKKKERNEENITKDQNNVNKQEEKETMTGKISEEKKIEHEENKTQNSSRIMDPWSGISEKFKGLGKEKVEEDRFEQLDQDILQLKKLKNMTLAQNRRNAAREIDNLIEYLEYLKYQGLEQQKRVPSRRNYMDPWLNELAQLEYRRLIEEEIRQRLYDKWLKESERTNDVGLGNTTNTTLNGRRDMNNNWINDLQDLGYLALLQDPDMARLLDEWISAPESNDTTTEQSGRRAMDNNLLDQLEDAYLRGYLGPEYIKFGKGDDTFEQWLNKVRMKTKSRRIGQETWNPVDLGSIASLLGSVYGISKGIAAIASRGPNNLGTGLGFPPLTRRLGAPLDGGLVARNAAAQSNGGLVARNAGKLAMELNKVRLQMLSNNVEITK